MCSTTDRRFLPDVTAPAAARRWATETVARWWSPTAVGLADDSALVVSELVTNAVRYSRGDSVTARLVGHRDRLEVLVGDDGGGRPVLGHAASTDTRGRGLALVADLSRRWGVTALGGDTTVWAVLGVPSGSELLDHTACRIAVGSAVVDPSDA